MTALENDLETLEQAMRTFFQIIKRPQHWARVMETTGIAIDRPSAAILHVLAAGHAHKCRVQDLAHQLGIEAPSITRKTQELEAAGLIKRVQDPDDRRAVDLQVTDKGRSVSRKLWKAQRESFNRVLSKWDKDERREFVRLFERFSTDFAQANASNRNSRKDQG